MGLDLSGNGSSQTMYDGRDWKLAVIDIRVGNSSVVDHKSQGQSSLHSVIVPDHMGAEVDA